MEREVNRRADEIVEQYIDKKLSNLVKEVREIGEFCDVGELVEKVDELNSWTKVKAGDDTDLYEAFKLHVYWQDGQVYILRGKELNE